MKIDTPAAILPEHGSRLLLETLKSASSLPYGIPLSGANHEDAANVAARFRLATNLYKSAVSELLTQYNDNLPMHRRIKRQLAVFLAAVDEIADDMEGAVENAVETE